MKNLKKIIALLTTVSISATLSASLLINQATAAQTGELYTQTYMEYLEDTEETGKVFTEDGKFAEDGLFIFGQNATSENVTLADTTQGGKCLQIVSGGKDVQVMTKKGLFKHDVTVIDMKVRAKVFNSNFPLVNILNNGGKMGSQSNGIVRFVNSASEIRAYNIADGTNTVTSGGNEWKDVRVILDSINKQIKVSVNGTSAVETSVFDTQWDNKNIQLHFQVALNSTLWVDNLVISDGTYMTDVYMDHDFEHSSTVGKAVGNNFFYGIQKTQNPVVVYDEETNNTYLDIANAAGNTIYTSAFNIEANKPVVMEFGLKTDATSNAEIKFRQSSSVQPTILTIANGIATVGSKTKNVADGKFHTYRLTFRSPGTGYLVSVIIDGTWLLTPTSSSNTYAGNLLDLRIVSKSGMASLDNLKIEYPQQPKILCDLDGKTDVALDTVVELVSNTRTNVSTANKAVITANGEAVGYTIDSNKYKNSYIYNIEGGLQPGTTYVISTGESGVRDFYDQYYNATVTFTTVAAEEEPSEEPTTPPTEEPTIPPTDEPTEEPTTPPTEEPKSTLTATSTVNISGSNAIYTVKAETDDAKGATVKCYIAQYKEDGTLIGVTVKDVVIAEGSTSKNDGGMIPVSADTKTIKVLTWDSETKAVGNAATATK